jgi:hypothetical protein
MVQNISIPLSAAAPRLLPPPSSSCCLVRRVAPLAGGTSLAIEAVWEDAIGESLEGCCPGARTKAGTVVRGSGPAANATLPD